MLPLPAGTAAVLAAANLALGAASAPGPVLGSRLDVGQVPAAPPQTIGAPRWDAGGSAMPERLPPAWQALPPSIAPLPAWSPDPNAPVGSAPAWAPVSQPNEAMPPLWRVP